MFQTTQTSRDTVDITPCRVKLFQKYYWSQ